MRASVSSGMFSILIVLTSPALPPNHRRPNGILSRLAEVRENPKFHRVQDTLIIWLTLGNFSCSGDSVDRFSVPAIWVVLSTPLKDRTWYNFCHTCIPHQYHLKRDADKILTRKNSFPIGSWSAALLAGAFQMKSIQM